MWWILRLLQKPDAAYLVSGTTGLTISCGQSIRLGIHSHENWSFQPESMDVPRAGIPMKWHGFTGKKETTFPRRLSYRGGRLVSRIKQVDGAVVHCILSASRYRFRARRLGTTFVPNNRRNC